MQASNDNNNKMSYDMQEGSDDLDVAGSKSSKLLILNHIKEKESDEDNTVNPRLSSVYHSVRHEINSDSEKLAQYYL